MRYLPREEVRSSSSIVRSSRRQEFYWSAVLNESKISVIFVEHCVLRVSLILPAFAFFSSTVNLFIGRQATQTVKVFVCYMQHKSPTAPQSPFLLVVFFGDVSYVFTFDCLLRSLETDYFTPEIIYFISQ